MIGMCAVTSGPPIVLAVTVAVFAAATLASVAWTDPAVRNRPGDVGEEPEDADVRPVRGRA